MQQDTHATGATLGSLTAPGRAPSSVDLERQRAILEREIDQLKAELHVLDEERRAELARVIRAGGDPDSLNDAATVLEAGRERLRLLADRLGPAATAVKLAAAEERAGISAAAVAHCLRAHRARDRACDAAEAAALTFIHHLASIRRAEAGVAQALAFANKLCDEGVMTTADRRSAAPQRLPPPPPLPRGGMPAREPAVVQIGRAIERQRDSLSDLAGGRKNCAALEEVLHVWTLRQKLEGAHV